ncbi:hypothetical protein HC931_25550 [Candidatus Gracilibacteria bacterium]|nr:hypothetical protein [Candidatus Gracilibacteria bacterium]NJP21872.1 hypothetical protein [Hydrococcus sp. CRU_1_1]NJQ97655.1 hypothetical protein [Hydrococcus sp. CSU_1_8]
MYQIIIQLPQDRSTEGEIHLEKSDGEVIAGPFRALGLSPGFLALTLFCHSPKSIHNK